MSDPNLENLQPPTRSSEDEPADGPVMSTGETLANIFFEPGRVFESLRARPRFLVAALIMAAILLSFTFLFFQRVGYENVVRAELMKSRSAAQRSPEQTEKAIHSFQSPAYKIFNHARPVITLSFFLIVGAALYFWGVMVMGRKITYRQALSVWTYASMPPFVLRWLLNVLLLFLKSADEIDPGQRNRGLVYANPGILIDQQTSPVLAAILGSLDIFIFYGLFLAALGLRKVAGLSNAAAWGIVLTLWLIGIIVRAVWAGVSGTTVG